MRSVSRHIKSLPKRETGTPYNAKGEENREHTCTHIRMCDSYHIELRFLTGYI